LLAPPVQFSYNPVINLIPGWEPLVQQITSPLQLLAVAQGYVNENKWEDASHYAQAALSADPAFTLARILFGEALVNLGDVDAGLVELESACREDDKAGREPLVRGLVARARKLSGERREDEALEVCDRALKLSPQNGAAYQLQLSLYMRKGDGALLRDDLEGASNAYRLAGDLKKAEQVHTLFRWQKQADVEARARSLEIDERWAEAIVMYEKLLEIAYEKDIKESWKTALSHCREEAELAVVFDEAMLAFQATDWPAAQKLLLALLNRRLDYHRGSHFATELLDHAVRADSVDFIQSLPVFSPLKLAPAMISIQNARRMVRLARWGMGKVGEVAFTRDDQYLVVSSSVGVYFYRKGKNEIVRFIDTDTAVECMSVSPDCSRIATGFEDGTILVWRVADGALIRKLRGHARKVTVLAFSPDSEVVASGADDGSVRLWNVADGKILMMMQGRLRGITGIDFSPDGGHVAIAGGDNKIRVQKIDDASLVRIFEGGEASYRQLAFAPAGRYLAAGVDTGAVEVWDPARTDQPRVLAAPPGPIQALRFSAQSDKLAAGSRDGVIRVWHLETGELQWTLDQHTAGPRSLTFSPGGNMLASSARDNTVRLWDLGKGQVLQTLDGFTGSIERLFVPSEGGLVLSTLADQTIRLMNLADGRQVSILGENMRPEYVACSQNGAWAAGITQQNRLFIWKLGNRQLVHTISLDEPVSSIAISAEGHTLALGSAGGGLQVFDTITGAVKFSMQAHPARIGLICFSPGGTMIATMGDDRSIKLWRASRGNLIQADDSFKDEIVSAEFTPDGTFLTCGTADGVIAQWKTTTSLIFHKQFQGHASAIRSLAHSPDSSILATGLTDGSIRVWQLANENLLHTLSGHGGQVTGLGFSPDGSLLLSAGTDSIIRLWGAVGK